MVRIVFRYAVDALFDVTVPRETTIFDKSGIHFEYRGYDYFVPFSGILWIKDDDDAAH